MGPCFVRVCVYAYLCACVLNSKKFSDTLQVMFRVPQMSKRRIWCLQKIWSYTKQIRLCAGLQSFSISCVPQPQLQVNIPPKALSVLYNQLIEPASSEPSAWAHGGTDVLTCQRQLTLNTTVSARAPQFFSQLNIIRLNYVEDEEGVGSLLMAPRG